MFDGWVSTVGYDAAPEAHPEPNDRNPPFLGRERSNLERILNL